MSGIPVMSRALVDSRHQGGTLLMCRYVRRNGTDAWAQIRFSAPADELAHSAAALRGLVENYLMSVGGKLLSLHRLDEGETVRG